MFDGCDFLAELTQHIPPKGIQYIRRYGFRDNAFSITLLHDHFCEMAYCLYASRTKGKWKEHPEIIMHAPEGWKATQQKQEVCTIEESVKEEECTVTEKASRKAWARLIAKIYEIDPFLYPKCGSEMRVVAVIQNTAEIRRILKHLAKIGRAPPGVDYSKL